MNPTPSFPVLAVTSALLLAAFTPANALTINQTQSNGTAGQSWLTTGSWSNNAAPSADNDYVSGSTMTLRSPTTTDSTFGGNSLTINGAQFNLTGSTGAGSAPGTISIADLRITGGGAVVNANGSNHAQTLAGGTVNFTGNSFFRLNANDTTARNITLSSQLTGDGNVGLMQKGTLTLNGAGNTFSGTWTVGGTNVNILGTNYTNSSLRVSTLDAFSSGSLGVNSSLVANNHSIIKIGYDWTTTGSLSLNANSLLFLEHDLAVGELSIAGSSLADGTYTYDFLNTNYAGFFNTTGAEGSITVGTIPEPSTYAVLAGAAALGLVAGFHRRRR